MTSDAFFATNKESFDFIFIDGLHEANQVFRDAMNSLEWLNPGKAIQEVVLVCMQCGWW